MQMLYNYQLWRAQYSKSSTFSDTKVRKNFNYAIISYQNSFMEEAIFISSNKGASTNIADAPCRLALESTSNHIS